MLALVFTGTPCFVHRISLVASLAWQVSESRSPSNREGCGFEDIVTVGFSEDRMQPKKEKKLHVKEKCFIRIQTEDPVIAFVTKSVMTVPINKPEMFNGFEIGFVNGINNTV